MIRNALTALAVSALALATPAFAATPDTGTVTITGSVGKKCKFTAGTATIALGELADADGKLKAGLVESGTATLTAWCNAPATVAVTANPIKAATVTAPSNQFDDRIEYTATATIGAVTANDTTDAGAAQILGAASSVGIFSSDIGIALSAASTINSGLLVADDYAGSVTVTLTPQ